jgi:hypothetical protein
VMIGSEWSTFHSGLVKVWHQKPAARPDVAGGRPDGLREPQTGRR